MKQFYVDRPGFPMPYKLPRKMKKAWKCVVERHAFPARLKWSARLHWIPCQGWTMTYTANRHAFARKGSGQ